MGERRNRGSRGEVRGCEAIREGGVSSVPGWGSRVLVAGVLNGPLGPLDFTMPLWDCRFWMFPELQILHCVRPGRGCQAAMERAPTSSRYCRGAIN